jgi:predicted amidohydrolase YtcJ
VTAPYPLRLVVANACVDGRNVHVELGGGVVQGFVDTLPPHALAIDAGGGRLLPGLADHHLHLLATAANAGSVDLTGIAATDHDALARALRGAARYGVVRATGLDDGGAALLDAAAIDAICEEVPVRVQYRTGGLWVLNGRAMEAALDGIESVPACFERGPHGLTGRVWRGDDVLRSRRGAPPLSLATLGVEFARHGVTAVTDANPSPRPEQAQAIAAAAAAMPQRLTVMSGAELPGASEGWHQGPVKVLLDEHALPSAGVLEARIRAARTAGRPIAVHCVTVAELALAIAVFEAEGVVPGDRIEHAMLVPSMLVAPLAGLGLTVVCQPAFLAARGDRYRRCLDPRELACLMPLATLARAGVRLAASSDAPYGPLNPWRAIVAATDRCTAEGQVLDAGESLSAEQALRLYLGDAADPAGPARRIVPGVVADLVVLKPGAVVGRDEDPVGLTIIDGRIVYRAGSVSGLGYDAGSPDASPLAIQGART